MAKLGVFLACLVILCAVIRAEDNEKGNQGRNRERQGASWAVQIIGGPANADAVARKYGFLNLGLVKGFSDVYHFQFSGKIQPEAHSIESHPDVVFAEQQVTQDLVPKYYVVPQDPLFTEQWNLLNNGQQGEEYKGNDLRVEQAWLQGVTGCNSTVSVVDDGIDYKHPDLWPNFAPTVSHDHVRNDTDPSTYQYTHGTSCSGIVASAKDIGPCGIGVAYDCNLGSVKLLDRDGATDLEVAYALAHARDLVDVYSNSWGPTDNGSYVAGPGTLTKLVLEQGTKLGRTRKGSIFVFANGNGRREDDDCGADGYSSSIYTIAVGAVRVDGHFTVFDEQCSAKMVVAYVTDDKERSEIRTTVTGGGCTKTFGGTSAATPMVSGAIALALEANPSLTWRDVQYLIVYTANHNLTVGPQTRNGGGLVVSRQYGFGVMDAEAMVTRARHWINVPPQLESHITRITQEQAQDAPYSASVNYTGQIQYLEHVVVRISVAIPENTHHLKRGDLNIKLTSPSGTLSVLLHPRFYDKLPGKYVDWPFMSVMFWGEDPNGQWNLTIRTKKIYGVANVSKVEFIFYGVSSAPEAVVNIPDQCHSDCRRGCAREGSNFCDSCVQYRNAHTLECIPDCPAGYTNRSSYCYDASLPIKKCSSTLKSKEGTGFTPNYEPVTCDEAGFTQCCPDGYCASTVLHPLPCFCDAHCYKFHDCCKDVAAIECKEENVTQILPYIDMGKTPGIETGFVGPEGYSLPIEVSFPFVTSLEPRVYVLHSGFFQFTANITQVPASIRVVAPFLSDTNRSSGSVSYEVHQGASSQEVLSSVNSIVNKHENTSFNGSWLLLAKWENVRHPDKNNNNTFQGMIVTDFTRSYAVFTYLCGDMTFSESDTIIGYIHTGTITDIRHGASFREFPHFISCYNVPHHLWVNVVYEIANSENECAINNGGCDQICTDTFLSFNCSCVDGYTLNENGSCSEDDECMGSDHGCEQICTNTPGSYVCNCSVGYQLQADGHSCKDDDECMGSDHGCEQICTNTPGSYVCNCSVGYQLQADGHSCKDDDECMGSDHGCEQICTNTPGSYVCNCSVGYQLQSDCRSCQDIDEYLQECSGQICGNTIGSYMCYCSSGYKLSEDNSTCDDIDECLGPDHGCEQVCVNTVGSYNCNCTEGYKLNTDERTCTDINECLMELDECDQICENTPGFYRCDCNSGSMLMPDNHTCEDVDECKTSMHECAQNCLNTEGSYLCSCRDSYVLNEDGLNCDVSCSGTFTDLFGFFNTPDWPDSYPSVDFSCVWEIVIDVPDASIVIQFNEPYGIHGSEPCESDYVEVLHGVGSNTTSLGKNCGTDVPGNIAVESNRATVVFRGSVSSLMDKPGVSISYKAVVEDLPFISLAVVGTPTRLPNVDDGVSDEIAVTNGFPLGCRHKPVVYVGTNGYFTFSRFTGFTPLTFSQGTGLSLVAPFFTDIDISKGHGSIAYVVNNLNSNTSRGLAQLVNTVINTNKLTNFNAQWLLIASWDDVTPYGNYRTKTSFQAILATDFIRSFAIFIYNCEEGKSRFSNHATIGYVTRDGFYENHVASSRNNPISYVSCLNDPTSEWTNVIYEVSGGGQCKR